MMSTQGCMHGVNAGVRSSGRHLGARVGVREAQLAAPQVQLLQALQEPGRVQAHPAHDLADELVAGAGDLGGLLDLAAQLGLRDSQLELGVLARLAAHLPW